MSDKFNPYDKNSIMKGLPGKDIPLQVKEQELRNALPGLWRRQPSQPSYNFPMSGEEESKGQQESKGEEPKGSIKKREESPTTKFGKDHPGLLDLKGFNQLHNDTERLNVYDTNFNSDHNNQIKNDDEPLNLYDINFDPKVDL